MDNPQSLNHSQLGVQIPCGLYPQVPSSYPLRATEEVFGRCVS